MLEDINRPVEHTETKTYADTPEKKNVAPPAWKPVEEWTSLDEGEVTTVPSTQKIETWNEILVRAGYDPDVYEIIEPVKFSSWDAQTAEGMETMFSYRAGIRLRVDQKSIPYDDLIREIKRHRPRRDQEGTTDSTFVVPLADWQVAKNDGDGLEGTVNRILKMIDDVDKRIRDLQKLGRKPNRLLVVGLGDLVEGCDGQYASQTFNVEVNRRQQMRILRRLLRDAIAKWAKHFNEVWVSAVPGNHGGFRKDGKEFTTVGDNDDIAVFEPLAEIFGSNEAAYGHVKFFLPEDDPFVTFDLHGKIVGFSHGHIAGSGGTPQTKIHAWWQKQAFNNQPIGQACIMFTGHYHHFSIIEYSADKVHIQSPAMDGGSEWFINLTGSDSRPGTITCVIDSNGYRDLEVL